MVFMGQGLKLLVADIERALALPAGAVTNVGTLGQPKPKVQVQMLAGQKLSSVWGLILGLHDFGGIFGTASGVSIGDRVIERNPLAKSRP